MSGNEYAEEYIHLGFGKPCGPVPATPSCLGIVFANRQAWNQLLKQNESLFLPRLEQTGGGIQGWHGAIIDPGSYVSVVFTNVWFASLKLLHGPKWLPELHKFFFCQDSIYNFT